jgi:hypothetical protein
MYEDISVSITGNPGEIGREVPHIAPLNSVFVFEFLYHGYKREPIEVGAQSKRRVYCRLFAGNAGSNTVRGRNVCLLSML